MPKGTHHCRYWLILLQFVFWVNFEKQHPHHNTLFIVKSPLLFFFLLCVLNLQISCFYPKVPYWLYELMSEIRIYWPFYVLMLIYVVCQLLTILHSAVKKPDWLLYLAIQFSINCFLYLHKWIFNKKHVEIFLLY